MIMQARLRKAIAASTAGTSQDSAKWAEAKKTCDTHVLYHPLVQRAYVVASTLQSSCSARYASRLHQLEESAIIVAKLGLDATIVAASLCQDALDCPCLPESLLAQYMPEEVIRLIKSIQKVKSVSGLHQSHPDLREQVLTLPMLHVYTSAHMRTCSSVTAFINIACFADQHRPHVLNAPCSGGRARPSCHIRQPVGTGPTHGLHGPTDSQRVRNRDRVSVHPYCQSSWCVEY